MKYNCFVTLTFFHNPRQNNYILLQIHFKPSSFEELCNSTLPSNIIVLLRDRPLDILGRGLSLYRKKKKQFPKLKKINYVSDCWKQNIACHKNKGLQLINNKISGFVAELLISIQKPPPPHQEYQDSVPKSSCCISLKLTFAMWHRSTTLHHPHIHTKTAG